MTDVPSGRRGSRQVLPLARRHSGDSTLVDRYLEEIGRHPLLSADDERRLAQRMERGRQAAAELAGPGPVAPERRAELLREVADGQQARRRFVEGNLRLVVAVARRYPGAGLAFLDLVQEGNIGLLRAVDRFDHRRGFRFSTYGTWLVRRSIARAIADTGRTIRLPVRTATFRAKVEQARHHLETDLGHPPTDDELATYLGLPASEVAAAARYGAVPVSLSAPVGEGGHEVGENVVDPAARRVADEATEWSVGDEVERLLCLLDDREREVVGMRFGLGGDGPCTVADVAAQLGLPPAQVTAISKTALAKLRRAAASRSQLRALLAG